MSSSTIFLLDACVMSQGTVTMPQFWKICDGNLEAPLNYAKHNQILLCNKKHTNPESHKECQADTITKSGTEMKSQRSGHQAAACRHK